MKPRERSKEELAAIHAGGRKDPARRRTTVHEATAHRHGDYTLHCRKVQRRDGSTFNAYFFARGKPASGYPCTLPAGYRVIETDNGLPVLQKIHREPERTRADVEADVANVHVIEDKSPGVWRLQNGRSVDFRQLDDDGLRRVARADPNDPEHILQEAAAARQEITRRAELRRRQDLVQKAARRGKNHAATGRIPDVTGDTWNTNRPDYQRSFTTAAAAHNYVDGCRRKGWEAHAVHVTDPELKEPYRVFARPGRGGRR